MPSAAYDVVVLNGGSSSGTSSIARAMQESLPGLWLTLGVDTFIDALPGRGDSSRADLTLRPDGVVESGPSFRTAERAWYAGVAAIARAGTPVVVDEVLLSGAAGQAVLADALAGLTVLWVGVRCDADVAAAREAGRADRVPGMARDQAVRVHDGVRYDLEVDSGSTDVDGCAAAIVARVRTSGRD